MRPGAIIFDLILGGVFLFVGYIYWPYLMLFLPISPNQPTSTYYIQIPKIKAYAPIVADVDQADESAYKFALKKGVAKAIGYSDFGEGGVVYLFAHSANYPWEQTRVNTSFLRLGELKVGDQIIVGKFGDVYNYEVDSKREVWPLDVGDLESDVKTNMLILQTSVPLGFDYKRLLVYAKFVSKEEN